MITAFTEQGVKIPRVAPLSSHRTHRYALFAMSKILASSVVEESFIFGWHSEHELLSSEARISSE